MSSVSSASSSSSRISGLMSNMDTDTIVKNMTSTQQAKIDKQEQKMTKYEWYNEALEDVMSSVKDFSNTYCSVLGTASMMNSSSYVKCNVTSENNSSAVTVSASSSADEGNITVKVSQIAVNTNISSTGKVSKGGNGIAPNNSATLAELSFANPLRFDNDGEICFSINGKTFTFKSSSTLQNMISTINSDVDANVTIKYNRLSDGFTITADSGGKNSKVSLQNITGNIFGANGAFQIDSGTVSNGQNSIAEINGISVEKDSNDYTVDGISYHLNRVTASSGSSTVVKQLAKSTSTSSSGKVSVGGTGISVDNTATLENLSFANKLIFDNDGNISFSINGSSFTFNKSTTLQSMLDMVNSDTHANVTMQYSRLKDAFTITSNSTGENSQVYILNNSGNAFGKNSAFQIDNGVVRNGCNSIAVIDGVTVERDTNSYTIDGKSYNFTQITDVSDQYVNFKVTKDYSATTDSMNTFVTALNKLITKLNDYVNVDTKTYKEYSQYAPLTDAQREKMSDDDIKKWEDKAKYGILRNNSTVAGLLDSLKQAFFTSAGGTGAAAASIGISTGSYFTSDKGLITVDKTKLKAALANNPDNVMSIFTGGRLTSADSDQGVMYKISNAISAFKKDATESISETDDKMDDVNDTIDKLEDKLDSLADKYYDQFSAMETALSKMNSQASYLSQLFK